MADFYLTQPPGGTRHHGGAHYAFADGHVKWLLPTSLAVSKKSDGLQPGFGL
jgi:prepilin-type processing-associated H-X9-DG protein